MFGLRLQRHRLGGEESEWSKLVHALRDCLPSSQASASSTNTSAGPIGNLGNPSTGNSPEKDQPEKRGALLLSNNSSSTAKIAAVTPRAGNLPLLNVTTPPHIGGGGQSPRHHSPQQEAMDLPLSWEDSFDEDGLVSESGWLSLAVKCLRRGPTSVATAPPKSPRNLLSPTSPASTHALGTLHGPQALLLGLPERTVQKMLKGMFDALDDDGQGQVSPSQIHKYLRLYVSRGRELGYVAPESKVSSKMKSKANGSESDGDERREEHGDDDDETRGGGGLNSSHHSVADNEQLQIHRKRILEQKKKKEEEEKSKGQNQQQDPGPQSLGLNETLVGLHFMPGHPPPVPITRAQQVQQRVTSETATGGAAGDGTKMMKAAASAGGVSVTERTISTPQYLKNLDEMTGAKYIPEIDSYLLSGKSLGVVSAKDYFTTNIKLHKVKQVVAATDEKKGKQQQSQQDSETTATMTSGGQVLLSSTMMIYDCDYVPDHMAILYTASDRHLHLVSLERMAKTSILSSNEERESGGSRPTTAERENTGRKTARVGDTGATAPPLGTPLCRIPLLEPHVVCAFDRTTSLIFSSAKDGVLHCFKVPATRDTDGKFQVLKTLKVHQGQITRIVPMGLSHHSQGLLAVSGASGQTAIVDYSDPKHPVVLGEYSSSFLEAELASLNNTRSKSRNLLISSPLPSTNMDASSSQVLGGTLNNLLGATSNTTTVTSPIAAIPSPIGALSLTTGGDGPLANTLTTLRGDAVVVGTSSPGSPLNQQHSEPVVVAVVHCSRANLLVTATFRTPFLHVWPLGPYHISTTAGQINGNNNTTGGGIDEFLVPIRQSKTARTGSGGGRALSSGGGGHTPRQQQLMSPSDPSISLNLTAGSGGGGSMNRLPLVVRQHQHRSVSVVDLCCIGHSVVVAVLTNSGHIYLVDLVARTTVQSIDTTITLPSAGAGVGGIPHQGAAQQNSASSSPASPPVSAAPKVHSLCWNPKTESLVAFSPRYYQRYDLKPLQKAAVGAVGKKPQLKATPAGSQPPPPKSPPHSPRKSMNPSSPTTSGGGAMVPSSITSLPPIVAIAFNNANQTVMIAEENQVVVYDPFTGSKLQAFPAQGLRPISRPGSKATNHRGSSAGSTARRGSTTSSTGSDPIGGAANPTSNNDSFFSFAGGGSGGSPTSLLGVHHSPIAALCISEKGRTYFLGHKHGRLCSYTYNTGVLSRLFYEDHHYPEILSLSPLPGTGAIAVVSWEGINMVVEQQAGVKAGGVKSAGGELGAPVHYVPDPVRAIDVKSVHYDPSFSVCVLGERRGVAMLYEGRSGKLSSDVVRQIGTVDCGRVEVGAVLVLQGFPAVATADNQGNIVVSTTAPHPAPNRRIAKYEGGLAGEVIFLAWYPPKKVLYAGDDKGKISAFDCTALLHSVNIKQPAISWEGVMNTAGRFGVAPARVISMKPFASVQAHSESSSAGVALTGLIRIPGSSILLSSAKDGSVKAWTLSLKPRGTMYRSNPNALPPGLVSSAFEESGGNPATKSLAEYITPFTKLQSVESAFVIAPEDDLELRPNEIQTESGILSYRLATAQQQVNKEQQQQAKLSKHLGEATTDALNDDDDGASDLGKTVNVLDLEATGEVQRVGRNGKPIGAHAEDGNEIPTSSGGPGGGGVGDDEDQEALARSVQLLAAGASVTFTEEEIQRAKEQMGHPSFKRVQSRSSLKAKSFTQLDGHTQDGAAGGAGLDANRVSSPQSGNDKRKRSSLSGIKKKSLPKLGTSVDLRKKKSSVKILEDEAESRDTSAEEKNKKQSSVPVSPKSTADSPRVSSPKGSSKKKKKKPATDDNSAASEELSEGFLPENQQGSDLKYHRGKYLPAQLRTRKKSLYFKSGEKPVRGAPQTSASPKHTNNTDSTSTQRQHKHYHFEDSDSDGNPERVEAEEDPDAPEEVDVYSSNSCGVHCHSLFTLTPTPGAFRVKKVLVENNHGENGGEPFQVTQDFPLPANAKAERDYLLRAMKDQEESLAKARELQDMELGNVKPTTAPDFLAGQKERPDSSQSSLLGGGGRQIHSSASKTRGKRAHTPGGGGGGVVNNDGKRGRLGGVTSSQQKRARTSHSIGESNNTTTGGGGSGGGGGGPLSILTPAELISLRSTYKAPGGIATKKKQQQGGGGRLNGAGSHGVMVGNIMLDADALNNGGGETFFPPMESNNNKQQQQQKRGGGGLPAGAETVDWTGGMRPGGGGGGSDQHWSPMMGNGSHQEGGPLPSSALSQASQQASRRTTIQVVNEHQFIRRETMDDLQRPGTRQSTTFSASASSNASQSALIQNQNQFALNSSQLQQRRSASVLSIDSNSDHHLQQHQQPKKKKLRDISKVYPSTLSQNGGAGGGEQQQQQVGFTTFGARSIQGLLSTTSPAAIDNRQSHRSVSRGTVVGGGGQDGTRPPRTKWTNTHRMI